MTSLVLELYGFFDLGHFPLEFCASIKLSSRFRNLVVFNSPFFVSKRFVLIGILHFGLRTMQANIVPVQGSLALGAQCYNHIHVSDFCWREPLVVPRTLRVKDSLNRNAPFLHKNNNSIYHFFISLLILFAFLFSENLRTSKEYPPRLTSVWRSWNVHIL